MKGSITTRRRADGSKSYHAIFRTPAGRQKWRTFDRKKDAEKFLASTVASVHARTYRDITSITFGAFAMTWLNGLGALKPSTARTYRSALEHGLIPAFGEMPIEAIGVEHVNAYLARREQDGRKPKTLRNQLALLHKLFEDARENGNLAVNRLTGSRAIRRPRAVRAEDSQEVEVFAPAEIHRLLDALDPHYRPYVTCGVSTGLRPGEIIGLQWGDLDVAAKVLHIRRTYYKGQDLVLKTRSSRRSVDLGDQLLSILGRLARERFDGEPPDLNAPIFLAADGTRIDPGTFRARVWTPALARAGLVYRRPYALRHTYATLMLTTQSVKYVQEQMGHASPTMTLGTYARWLPRERREAPSRFEAQLAAGREEASNSHLTDGAEWYSTGEYGVDVNTR